MAAAFGKSVFLNENICQMIGAYIVMTAKCYSRSYVDGLTKTKQLLNLLCIVNEPVQSNSVNTCIFNEPI